MKNVTLLVCLSPSIAPELIDEVSFYGLVNQITPVSNLKMVSKEGQLKAFVQVQDESAATEVINGLHGKTFRIGKVKVYLSHKKFINFERPLFEIFNHASLRKAHEVIFENETKLEKDPNSASTSCYIHKNSKLGFSGLRSSGFAEVKKLTDTALGRNIKALDQGCYFIGCNGPNMAQKSILNKNSNVTSDMEEREMEKRRISITNEDPLELKSKKISEVFGQFGKIVKKTYDSANLIWTLLFDSEESAVIACVHVKNGQVDDYKIVDRHHVPTNAAIPTMDVNKLDTHNLFGETSRDSYNRNSSDVSAHSSLRISDNSQTASAEAICRLIARVHTPIQIMEARDISQNTVFFLIKFINTQEAVNVYEFLNDRSNVPLQMETTFA